MHKCYVWSKKKSWGFYIYTNPMNIYMIQILIHESIIFRSIKMLDTQRFCQSSSPSKNFLEHIMSMVPSVNRSVLDAGSCIRNAIDCWWIRRLEPINAVECLGQINADVIKTEGKILIDFSFCTEYELRGLHTNYLVRPPATSLLCDDVVAPIDWQ